MESSSKHSLLIIEDHPMMAEMIQEVVGLLNNEIFICTSTSLSEALVMGEAHRFALVVFDLNIDDSSEEQTILGVSKAFTNAKLAAFHGSSNLSSLALLEELGIASCSKVSSYSQFTAFLSAALFSARLISKPPAARPLPNEHQSLIYVQGSEKPLTKRQVLIMEWMTKGLSHKEIARQLSISTDTVKSHIKEAYYRLGARSKSDAVKKYIDAKRLSSLSNKDRTPTNHEHALFLN